MLIMYCKGHSTRSTSWPSQCPVLSSRAQVGPSVTVFLISTYTDGLPPDSAQWFCQWLQEAVDDFRVQKSLLAHLKFAVFGSGNSLYAQNYNAAAKNLFDWLGKLSASPVCALGLGDQNVSQSPNGGIAASLYH